jgi:hypothetical protein
MSVHHLTVTLAGATAQAISPPAAGLSINAKEVQIQGEASGAIASVGGRTVSSTDYGQSIAATSVAPIILRPNGFTTINLADTFIIGTTSNKFHILYVL